MAYRNLRQAIREKYRTNGEFAEALGIDQATLSAKLNDKRDWKSDEIARACALLDIPAEKVYEYFFSKDGCMNATY